MEKFQADTVSVKSLFHKGTNFNIPLYQRNYSWQFEQIRELMEDLLEFVNNEIKEKDNTKKYYMGNIILKIDQLNNDSEVLIDGQQRITTFLLFLKAIKDVIDKNFPTEEWLGKVKKDINKMIFYKKNTIDKEKDKRIKLFNSNGNHILNDVLSTKRNELLEKIKDDKKIKNSNFFKNYEAIYKFLLEQITYETDVNYWLYDLLSKLVFVRIYITNEEDEHDIFENINSKGKDLSITDLIKNYLYIYAEKVFGEEESQKIKIEALFNDKITKKLNDKEAASFFKLIVSHYTGLWMDDNQTKEIYKEFKDKVLSYENAEKTKIIDFIDFLEKAFNVYEYVKSFAQKNPKSEYEFIMNIMNQQLMTTYFSLLLKNIIINSKFNINDEDNLIEVNDDFIQFIKIIEEYWLKVKIIYDNENKFSSKVKEILVKYKREFLSTEKFKNELSNNDIYSDNEFQLPKNIDVKNTLIESDVKSSNLAKHILYKINHHEDTKESNYTNMNNIKIEYIIPKDIKNKKCWIDALGENWEEKHASITEKLGNLTLIGNKDDVEGSCFDNEGIKKSKKERYSESQIVLTKKLSELDQIDEKTINERTEKLSNIFISLFE